MKRRATCGLAAMFVSGLCMANDAALESALQARWTEAYNSGDIKALGAMYAADARLQQGYCPAVTGRDAIEAFWRADLGEAVAKTYLLLEDSLSVDGLLYLRGNYAVEIAGAPGADARRVGGTFSQVWRHEDATGWTIHRETWSNLACADIVVEPPSAGGQPRAQETGTAI